MQPAPQWAFGNSQCPRLIGIEPSQPGVFDERVAQSGRTMMGHRERADRITIALDLRSRLELRDLHGVTQPLTPEKLGALEKFCGATRPPKAHRLRTALQLQRTHETNHTEHMVGMEVREEYVGHGERDAVAHHLPLRTLAAVDEQGLPLANDGDTCHVSLHRGTRSGGTEKSKG